MMENDDDSESRLYLTVNDGQRDHDSATFVVVLSTLVAVCGSYVFGSAVGFSSPAQTAIMLDLGLSLEEFQFLSVSSI
ncbi:hypothetical protein Tco_1298544 [Tanacetum coccineum]